MYTPIKLNNNSFNQNKNFILCERTNNNNKNFFIKGNYKTPKNNFEIKKKDDQIKSTTPEVTVNELNLKRNIFYRPIFKRFTNVYNIVNKGNINLK